MKRSACPFRTSIYTDRLTGNVAIQIRLPTNSVYPSPSTTILGVDELSRVLMPAKNSAAANSTTASE